MVVDRGQCERMVVVASRVVGIVVVVRVVPVIVVISQRHWVGACRCRHFRNGNGGDTGRRSASHCRRRVYQSARRKLQTWPVARQQVHRALE